MFNEDELHNALLLVFANKWQEQVARLADGDEHCGDH
jgi:hypothetical protein